MQMLAALLCCCVWLAFLLPASYSDTRFSLSGRNDVSGTWVTRVNDAQINITHHTNATDVNPWIYGDWEHNMTFTSTNLVSQKTGNETNKTDWNYDVIIVDVNSARNETSSPGLLRDKMATVRDTARADATIQYPGYTKFPGLGLYKLHYEALPWADAVEACDEEQSYLAIVDSQREADAISELFRPYGGGVSAAYIGLNDIRTEGNFVSIMGERMDQLGYNNWDEGQPDGSEQENCVVISGAGLMSDEACYITLPYICEAWLLD